ncbi:carboxymuconolactone decarboxylase family protein [uncultured Croceitalea sp.]|uniref:carboxymuconolactone decarboxylase family protein n=1 Tax=uncultured Croceitalea sp. TaxID=1798908 RepID=UPI00374F164A
MITFDVPKREDVSENNQVIFDTLKKSIGFVPNLFATMANSKNGLKNYLDFSNAKSSLKAKEKEVVNLAVSQVNNCEYCLSAHTAVSKMNGFTEEEIIEFRQGKSSKDLRLDALARFARNITENRGRTSPEVLENFFNNGWTKENMVDAIMIAGDKTVTNYLNNTTRVPVDFPVAQPLETELV